MKDEPRPDPPVAPGPPTRTRDSPKAPATADLRSVPHAAVGAGDGDFSLQQSLGRGGMGIVDLAVQRSLGREVALKRLADPSDQRGVNALLREARVTSRLEHPGIVPVHGIFRDTELGPVVAMKRVEGATWRAKMMGGAQDPRVHVRIAIEVCFALEYAHSRGVLHLDVKPDNVIVGDFGEVCLVDWGIALERGEPTPARPIGTPAYLAPEMVSAALGPLAETSDVYLLGGCLFESLFGHPPHGARTDAAAMAAALDGVAFPEDARTPGSRDSGSPPSEIVGICRRALATDPDARFPTVADLRRSLESFLEHQDAERLMSRVLLDLSSATDLHALRELEVRLQQALSLWPTNPRGLAAERMLAQRLMAHHIEGGDLSAARNAADRLAWLPPDLRAGLASLESERNDERAALDQQRRRTREVEFSVQGAFRQRTMLALTAILVGLPIVSQLRTPGYAPSPPEDLVVYCAIACVAWVSALLVWRARFFANFANRVATLAITAAFGASLLNRILALPRQTDPVDIVRTDLLVIGALLTALSALDRVFGVLACLCVVGCVLAALEPLAIRTVFNGAIITCALMLNLRWQRLAIG
ncbi:MAG: protein kinase [Myxococcota bacterium]